MGRINGWVKHPSKLQWTKGQIEVVIHNNFNSAFNDKQKWTIDIKKWTKDNSHTIMVKTMRFKTKEKTQLYISKWLRRN